MRPISGFPATGSAAFARTSDKGRSLVARPAVRTSAGQSDRSLIRRGGACSGRSMNGREDHVAFVESMLVAVANEQHAVRIGDVVGRALAERHRGVIDVIFAAFNLD